MSDSLGALAKALRWPMWLAAVLFGVAQLLASPAAFALDVPALTGRVNDQAQLLGPEQREALERRLAEYERGSGHQFALLTLPSLKGEAIEEFSLRVVESWQLGSSEADDGVLLLVVPGDRRMRIEVGYGLEGAIPDALAGRIVRNVLGPAFRAGEYYQGIDRAFDLLMQAAGGQPVDLPAEPRAAPQSSFGEFGFVFFAVLLTIILASRGGRGGGALLLGGAMMGAGRRRGYGGGGFGGGGGFSGGGGGFGGGGASGSW